MTGPYPIISLLGSLVFVMRHERDVPGHLESLIQMLRSAMVGTPLELAATSEALRVNSETISWIT